MHKSCQILFFLKIYLTVYNGIFDFRNPNQIKAAMRRLAANGIMVRVVMMTPLYNEPM